MQDHLFLEAMKTLIESWLFTIIMLHHPQHYLDVFLQMLTYTQYPNKKLLSRNFWRPHCWSIFLTGNLTGEMYVDYNTCENMFKWNISGMDWKKRTCWRTRKFIRLVAIGLFLWGHWKTKIYATFLLSISRNLIT